MPNLRQRLYELMDSFLVESNNLDGTPYVRSVDRLNQDRHLFVQNVEQALKAAIDQAIGDMEDPNNPPREDKSYAALHNWFHRTTGRNGLRHELKSNLLTTLGLDEEGQG